MLRTTEPAPASPRHRPLRRLWKTPLSHAWWLWLLAASLFYAGLFYLYYRESLHGSAQFSPGNGAFAKFGIVALGILGLTATYTLRRRFMRFLPGQARNWLWMHTWFGITTVLIVMLHANFDYVLRDYCLTSQCLADTYAGPFALYGVILLVGSGITGRVIDVWQTRAIARDASTNGVGIAQALQERINGLTHMLERLYAGKSDPFQQWCIHAMNSTKALPAFPPVLSYNEQADLQLVFNILAERAKLLASLQRQLRAQRFIRRWRAVHITLAIVAVCMIGTHLSVLVINKLHFFFR